MRTKAMEQLNQQALRLKQSEEHGKVIKASYDKQIYAISQSPVPADCLGAIEWMVQQKDL